VSFGAVIDLWWSAHWSRYVTVAIIASVAVVFVLSAFDQSVLLVVLALVVVAATAATISGFLPTGAPKRAPALAYGAILVITTLTFTAYIGAETPDAGWFGGGTVHGPTRGREVALTFDDGPNIGSTRKVMQILDRYDVKGT